MPLGENRKTGTPSPSAKQTEPHEPEPPAERHVAHGARPNGQAPPGKLTRHAREETRKRTRRAERSANAHAADPETRKTDSREDGKPANRPVASIPAAQPTANTPDQGEATSDDKKDEAAADKPGDGQREPESPTTGKAETSESTDVITNKLLKQ